MCSVHKDWDVCERCEEAEFRRGGADSGQVSHQDLEETAWYSSSLIYLFFSPTVSVVKP